MVIYNVLAKKNQKYKNRIIVLKNKVTEQKAQEIIEKKKTGVFKKLLTKPKKDLVYVDSLNIYYESILLISGTYKADYYRRAVHTIKVDYNVREVIIGKSDSDNQNDFGVFFPRTKSGLQKTLAKKSKNKVDIELEEHVFIKNKDVMYFDHNGHKTEFDYKIDSKSIENYPSKILNKNKANVKKLKLTYEKAQDKLMTKLKEFVEKEQVRDITEEFVVDEISEIYIPIFEARLVGPRKKAGIIRIDAVRNKIL